MKFIATRKSEQNEAPVDPWTAVHVGVGLAFGLMDIPLRWAIAAAVAYELIEQVLERHPAGQELLSTSRPESPPNAIMDTAVFIAGHRLGALWNES
jgi:hypothetical protein